MKKPPPCKECNGRGWLASGRSDGWPKVHEECLGLGVKVSLVQLSNFLGMKLRTLKAVYAGEGSVDAQRRVAFGLKRFLRGEPLLDD